MTCFNIDELEKKFKEMKFLEITKDDNDNDGSSILKYICEKNIKHEEMLKLFREIRNKQVHSP